MKKRILSLLMAGVTLLMLAVSVSAKVPDGGISPCWIYMDDIYVDIGFSGSTGTATLWVSKKSTATKLEGTLTVYKMVGDDWVYVDSKSDSSTRTLSIDFDFDAKSGVKYKAVADVTAYGSGGSETDGDYKIKTCP